MANSCPIVLEIGVYLGFSSLIWAEAVGPSGKVTGLEYEEASAKIAREAYAKHKAAQAEVIVGDGHKTYVFWLSINFRQWLSPIQTESACP
jgi:predicted O-methyltransferase YrrM